MGKIEERGKIYAIHKASDKLDDYYGNSMLSVVQFDGYDIQKAYVDGYFQSEQDLEVKDVDLDKELDFVKDAYYYFTSDERSNIKKVARHFFELGLKAKENKK